MRIKLQNWLNKWFHIVPPLGWFEKYEAERLLKKLITTRHDLPECSCYDCNVRLIRQQRLRK